MTIESDKIRGQNYLIFKAQSNTVDPLHLQEKTDKFVQDFVQKFDSEELLQEF
jgi:hypothetical protein